MLPPASVPHRHPISLFDDDPFNTGIDDHLRTQNTGLIGAVKRSVVNRHAKICRLYDGILFGVDSRQKLVTFPGRHMQRLPLTASYAAVFDPAGHAVISRRQNPIVFTIIAPTARRRQVERFRATSAISIKYSSQPGLSVILSDISFSPFKLSNKTLPPYRVPEEARYARPLPVARRDDLRQKIRGNFSGSHPPAFPL